MVDKKNKSDKEGVVDTPKPKKYTVKIEALVPATYTYVIEALSPEEAGEVTRLRRMVPKQIQHKNTIPKMKKVTVYEYGMSIIKFMKNLF